MRKENGITIITLVITIIIIIILSTVTINMAFGDNGLIKQAQQTKDSVEESITDKTAKMNKLLQEYSNTISEDAEIAEPPVSIKVGDLIGGEPLPATTQIEDDSGDKMWVPGGFGIAEDSATDIDRGVVITDGINEFVWIPVSDGDLAEMYSTTTPETASDTTLAQSTLGEAATTTKIYSKLRIRSGDGYTAGAPNSTDLREPDILTDTTYGDASTTASRGINLIKSELGYEGDSATVLKNFAQDMVNEYLAVFNSIKEYDGFYIGRYELTGTADNPTVQRYQPVLTSASSSANTWYGLKDACNKVVTGNDKDAQSHMIYGNQWDEVMDWLVDTEAKTDSEVNIDSSTWGNYRNYVSVTTRAPEQPLYSPEVSGYRDEWSANNIYDLARKLL